MTVRLQHMVLWPLAAVALGAACGLLLPRRREVRRSALLLASEIKLAHDGYSAARRSRNRAKGSGLVDLEDVESSPIWRRGPRNWRKPPLLRVSWWFKPPPTSGVGGLYSRLGRVHRKEGLADLTAEAQAQIARMNGWTAINSALKQLATAIAESRSVDGSEGSRALRDAEQLFVDEVPISDDEAAAAAQTERITSQAAALRLLVQAAPLHAELHERAEHLPEDDDRRRLARADPERIYLRYSPGRRRSATADAALLLELRDALGELGYLRGRLPSAQAGLVRPVDGEAPVLVAFASPAHAARRMIEWLGEVVAPRGAPSREAVLAGVRRADWFQFGLTLAISSLVYLLPLYLGKPWGSLADYAAAFAAGFAGQVVVNEALIPLTRSLRGVPEPEQPTDAAKVAPA